MQLLRVLFLLFVVAGACIATAQQSTPKTAIGFDDPSSMKAVRATGEITVDGRMTEPDWNSALPYLVFGTNPLPDPLSRTVTGGLQVRGIQWDPSNATVKFLWKEKRLFIGVRSADHSVGSFGDSWEGDGLFMKVKDAGGNADREFKLSYNAPSRAFTPAADSAVYETGGGLDLHAGYGVGLVCPCSIPYDSTQVDSGYTLELEIRLDSLGFACAVDSLSVLINIFDPDGYHFDARASEGPDSRSFAKTWWGSEAGPEMRTVKFLLPTDVEPAPVMHPGVFALRQNYPNPFNPTTTIRFDVAAQSAVRIDLFDIIGRTMQTLASGDYGPGSYSVVLDASTLASGMYFYRMISKSGEAGDANVYVETRKLHVLK